MGNRYVAQMLGWGCKKSQSFHREDNRREFVQHWSVQWESPLGASLSCCSGCLQAGGGGRRPGCRGQNSGASAPFRGWTRLRPDPVHPGLVQQRPQPLHRADRLLQRHRHVPEGVRLYVGWSQGHPGWQYDITLAKRESWRKNAIHWHCAGQGATKGRVCYEVRIDRNQSTSHLGQESSPHVLRCGW